MNMVHLVALAFVVSLEGSLFLQAGSSHRCVQNFWEFVKYSGYFHSIGAF